MYVYSIDYMAEEVSGGNSLSGVSYSVLVVSVGFCWLVRTGIQIIMSLLIVSYFFWGLT